MLKLPSPSVICAQNSPLILTTGLTLVRSTSMAFMESWNVMQAVKIFLALKVIVVFAINPLATIAQHLVALELGIAHSGARA